MNVELLKSTYPQDEIPRDIDAKIDVRSYRLEKD